MDIGVIHTFTVELDYVEAKLTVKDFLAGVYKHIESCKI